MDEIEEVLWTEDPDLEGTPQSEDDSLDAMCGECGSLQNEKRVIKWYQEGVNPSCGFCGGACVFVWRSQIEKAQINRQRGMSDEPE